MQGVGYTGPPSAKTVVDFLAAAVGAHGPRDALLIKPAFRYLRWTYRQVWEDSGRVAALLQQRGVAKGDQVILWAPNSPQWVIAFFGCLRAGAVVIPLDLRSAPDYVERVIARTEPKVAITSRLTPDDGVDLGVPRIDLEVLESEVAGLGDPLDVDIAPGDLAEIMFTSGTTGDPKGVMLTHRNLTANIEGIIQYISCGPSSRLLSILPLSHMYEQMGGLFVAMHYGASITYPTSRQPTVLARTMRERRITILLLVPQGLELLMNGIEREVRRQGRQRLWNALLGVAARTPFRLRRLLFGRVHRQFGGRLELIVSGGAALDPGLGGKWELLGVRVLQGYGATEASPVISNHSLDDRRLDSAGRPLPNVEVRISEAGEIWVRGESVTPGYWRAPDATTAAFEDGWYRTGDLGYLDDEGFLHIQGRLKDMIVLPSGQNVFPEDVEAALAMHPEVTDATVVGLKTGSSVEVHAALICRDEDAAAGAVAWTNDRLAEHQRIRGWTLWPGEDFPRTHTLKVKKRLVIDAILGGAPAQEAAAARPASSPGGPRGLAQIVADVGGLDPAGLDEGLRLGDDLGLDSLGRVELLSAIEAEMGVYVDESQLGPETSLRELAALVEEGLRNPPLLTFPEWGMRWWCRMLRGLLQRTLVFPLMSLAYGLRVVGAENLAGVSGPALLAANHHLGLDNPLIIRAVPNRWRRRMAIAGAAELWRNPLWWVLNPLLGNGFPLARDGAVRPSLENMGKIMDNGWSVLIYPEGELSVGGPLGPFLNGTGLVAVEGRVPVVPVRLCVLRPGFPARLPLLRRGTVEVRLGEPLSFPPGTGYQEATSAIEDAVRSL